ncbi:iron-regulated protein A precursor [Bdellovibrio bacteriovorus]|uniref:Iron-regulated protein A n=1 Tax=Bdellovibrio bacteriovorus TaxID=959 RepID=A0A162H110_BDEBC|nr:imelysin family protein [Bdellovibrio bacteriovorus]KYG69406.1 iron-regulated protein A precursor [Bdellovibrio bacteriovorus]
MKALKLMAAALAFVGATAQAATNQEIINHVSYNVILATYNDLASQAANLNAAVNTLAANPTEANLAKAQDAWRATRIPWESSEAFLFGPVDSLGIDPLLDTWPLNILDLDSVLKSNRAITTDFVRALGTNLQGFHTIEYLLFGDGKSANTKPASALTAKQFEYLKATTALLAENTAYLANSWSKNYDPENPSAPGYVQVISNPGFDNPFYSSDRAVMEEFVQGMMGILDEVANGKMSDPMGADINSANMALVESPFSWNSLNDFTNNIRSVYSIYTGHYRSTKGPGVKALVERVDAALAARVEGEILNCMQLIQAIRPAGGGDFGQAIFTPDGRARAQKAIDALNALHATMENEVLPTLDM